MKRPPPPQTSKKGKFFAKRARARAQRSYEARDPSRTGGVGHRLRPTLRLERLKAADREDQTP